MAIAAALILAATGCGQGDGRATSEATTPTSAAAPASGGSATGTATTATTAPSSSSASTASPTSPTSPTSGTGSGTGCAAGSADIPAGAAQAPVIDVDGDGRPDTGWIVTEPSGAVRVGIVTAAGGGFGRAFTSASPVTRSVLVLDVNPDTPPLVLANDGRAVQLWAVIDCSIVDVLNKGGRPYTFSLGFTDIGTGVGCTTVKGRRELVGLDAGDPQGDTVPWSATVVEVRGNQARNGAVTSGTYTRGVDDAAIERLRGVSCGDAAPITAPES
ncbi:MAG: hypothetical protein R2761_14450 [Acidimicrobiales bacterium]